MQSKLRGTGFSNSISEINNNLRARRNIKADLLRLTKIQKHLDPQTQLKFESIPGHSQCLQEMNQLNAAFIPTLQQLNLYKPELAYQLQSLVESYNMIFLD